MLDPMLLRPILAALIRHGLAALGATAAVNDEGVAQLAGAALTLVMVGWSVAQKVRAVRRG